VPQAARPQKSYGNSMARLNAALVNPKVKARLAELGGTGLPLAPADFGRLIAGETEKRATVVKFAGAKPEGNGLSPT